MVSWCVLRGKIPSATTRSTSTLSSDPAREPGLRGARAPRESGVLKIYYNCIRLLTVADPVQEESILKFSIMIEHGCLPLLAQVTAPPSQRRSKVVKQLGSGNESVLPDGTWVGHESELVDTQTIVTLTHWRARIHKRSMKLRLLKFFKIDPR